MSPSGKEEIVSGEYLAFSFFAKAFAIFSEFPQVVIMMLSTSVVSKEFQYIKVTNNLICLYI